MNLATPPDTMNDHIAALTQLARKAANGYFRNLLNIEFKSDESPVTQADKGIEAEIRDYLRVHFPNDGIFGEEHGIEGADRDHMWVIDPIDGTRSFLSGNPLFGFLMARLDSNGAELGVIEMPALQETFVGHRGKGATLNKNPIRVSTCESLKDSVLYVNEGEKIFRNHPEVFDHLMSVGQTRRLGYDCYPHALVAMGHVDAVIDYDLQPYDYLAVAPVVTEAGGIMTDWQGNPVDKDRGTAAVISAATPELHAELLALVNGQT